MKPFPIFRTGRHTASSGAALDFSEDDLRAAVKAYDPALHEAPIVVGHPRDNAPAYGWVGSLSFTDGEVKAEPQQVDAAFAELVKAGRFKKRSASWYLPDAPNNPQPGTLYLRHVGFLGAQPPAVKGLKDVSFADDEDGVIEFSDSAMVTGILAMFMRRMREFLIAEHGTEKADSVLPDFLVGDIENEARKPPEADDETPSPAAMPAYSEDDAMTIEQLQAQVAALTAERDALKANADQAASFAERETAIAARETTVAEAEKRISRAAIEARIDAVVQAGRMLPAQRAGAVSFACALPADAATVEFGEGDKAEKVTPREHYLRQLEARPKIVDYREHSRAGDNPPDDASGPEAVAEKARELVRTRAAEGKHISFTEAVSLVMTAE
ncbi:MAG: peptidase [bacterium]|jgi:hypothetical protein